MKPICVTAQTLTIPLWKPLIDGRYVVNSENGCWEWTGRLDRHGYGEVKPLIGGRRRRTGAHRASWIAHRGPILGNLQIDHLCRNRRCINPFHMEPVTSQENTRRGMAAGSYDTPGIGRPSVPLELRDGCRKHGESDGYWRTRKDGYTAWHCRICTRERGQRWRANRKAA